jgi:O-antigen/teichoic acid export membrane protein
MGLFGPGFVDAAPCLRVLAWALMLMFVNRFTGTLLTAAGRQGMLVKLCAVVLVANVVLNLLLIPRYGRMGAAWVTLLCECGFLPTLLLLSRRYLDLGRLRKGLWRPCLAAAGMGGFCWYFGGLSLLALVPCGAAVYGLLLAATYLLRAETGGAG